MPRGLVLFVVAASQFFHPGSAVPKPAFSFAGSAGSDSKSATPESSTAFRKPSAPSSALLQAAGQAPSKTGTQSKKPKHKAATTATPSAADAALPAAGPPPPALHQAMGLGEPQRAAAWTAPKAASTVTSPNSSVVASLHTATQPTTASEKARAADIANVSKPLSSAPATSRNRTTSAAKPQSTPMRNQALTPAATTSPVKIPAAATTSAAINTSAVSKSAAIKASAVTKTAAVIKAVATTELLATNTTTPAQARLGTKSVSPLLNASTVDTPYADGLPQSKPTPTLSLAEGVPDIQPIVPMNSSDLTTLMSHLHALTLSGLRKCALAVGVDEADVDKAEDSVNPPPRDTLMALVETVYSSQLNDPSFLNADGDELHKKACGAPQLAQRKSLVAAVVHLTVDVPQGYKAGDTMHVSTPTGDVLKVTMPAGIKPGGVLLLHTPGKKKHTQLHEMLQAILS
jgi:hypothetical protein